ncbi:S24/S26 family peptidase [Carboxylicivirga taeanensis]|uniref:S24/S26 family peptidase n=1 Tax=Carboxylicivirga taeanensis TaxID=1416875 RepID=UPI003F6DBC06
MAKQKLQQTLIELLKEGHQVEVPAKGMSMYPLLQPGDKLLVKPIRPQVGDIGVFCKNNQLIAHRLIHFSNNTYYFKGDALTRYDSATTAQEVLGTVIARKRGKKQETCHQSIFKLFKILIPKFTIITGHLFYYCGRLHNKISHLQK